MDNIMTLKDHSGFKYIHGSRFMGQCKDRVFVCRKPIDLPGSDVDLVKRIQVGGDMENSWIMFDHVKHMKDRTALAYQIYNKYCKMLTIVCRDMQSVDGVVHILFWKNFNFFMMKNEISKMNFKDFMTYNVQTNWNEVKKIYGGGGPNLPMIGR